MCASRCTSCGVFVVVVLLIACANTATLLLGKATARTREMGVRGARSVVSGRMVRTRGMLVVAEVALAVVLLTGAGLLIKSLMALHRTELGVRPDNVLVIKATGVGSDEDVHPQVPSASSTGSSMLTRPGSAYLSRID
jgi:hypothetical protein